MTNNVDFRREKNGGKKKRKRDGDFGVGNVECFQFFDKFNLTVTDQERECFLIT